MLRVSGVGFTVSGFGLALLRQGLGCRVQALGLRVLGVHCFAKAWDVGFDLEGLGLHAIKV